MNNLRSWATPITVGAFFISTVTGIVLFFHLDLGLAKPAHEWLSWFLVLGVGLHLVINWRAFLNYFKKRIPVAIMGAFAIVTVLSLLPLTEGEGNSSRETFKKTLRLAENAEISTLAELTGNTADELVAKLQSAGLQVEGATATLKQIAKANKARPIDVLRDIVSD